MKNARGVVTPGVKDAVSKKHEDEEGRDIRVVPATAEDFNVDGMSAREGKGPPNAGEGRSCIVNREQQLSKRGWTQHCRNWKKNFVGSDGMIDLPVEGVARRTTWKSEGSELMEDLWIGRRTPQRLLSRKFRNPCTSQLS